MYYEYGVGAGSRGSGGRMGPDPRDDGLGAVVGGLGGGEKV